MKYNFGFNDKQKIFLWKIASLEINLFLGWYIYLISFYCNSRQHLGCSSHFVWNELWYSDISYILNVKDNSKIYCKLHSFAKSFHVRWPVFHPFQFINWKYEDDIKRYGFISIFYITKFLYGKFFKYLKYLIS